MPQTETNDNEDSTDPTPDTDVDAYGAHKHAKFKPGDKIPWGGDYAVVTATEVVPEWDNPNNVSEDDDRLECKPPEWSPPNKDNAPVVLVTLDLPDRMDEAERTVSASWLHRQVDASFNEGGLPSVSTQSNRGIGAGGTKVEVQTPATGNNAIADKDARELAQFLRENAEFEPLYALLGDTDSPEDMHAIADALDRAAQAQEINQRDVTSDE